MSEERNQSTFSFPSISRPGFCFMGHLSAFTQPIRGVLLTQQTAYGYAPMLSNIRSTAVIPSSTTLHYSNAVAAPLVQSLLPSLAPLQATITALHSNQLYMIMAVLGMSSAGIMAEKHTQIGKAMSAPIVTVRINTDAPFFAT